MAPRRAPRAHSAATVTLRLRVLAPLLLLACACGSAGTARDTAATPVQNVTLFAAASTATVMAREIAAFEAQHHGIHVDGDYEGTQSLLAKLEADPTVADILLSADTRHMDDARSRGLVAASHTMAANRLVIAVPPGNPAHVQGLADLARPGLRLVLADRAVPAGSYAVQALQTAEQRGDIPRGAAQRALANAVSLETDVEAVVAKVASGEVDAGIVYATDTAADHRVAAVPIPGTDQPPTAYPIALTTHARARAAAQHFVDFLLGPQGQQILRQAGFLPAPTATSSP